MVRRLDDLRFAGFRSRARLIGLWTVAPSSVVLSALIGTRVGLATPLGWLEVHAERPRAPEFVLHDTPRTERTFFSDPPFMLDRTAGQALRPLAFFFEQGACHPCDVLHSEEVSGDEVEALMEHFEVVQLDMWVVSQDVV